ncbi:MAG: hypothetical protein KBE23_13120 [Chloroflexi bacterium]|nr:hypothetical protein [Chloroflexota bacterium]
MNGVLLMINVDGATIPPHRDTSVTRRPSLAPNSRQYLSIAGPSDHPWQWYGSGVTRP